MSESLKPQYFDDLYAKNSDPWDFLTSSYEAAKYHDTVATLPRRYERALEIGCSIGVLTRLLAQKCESLLSLDVSELALNDARARCADLSQVRFARIEVPREFPEGLFDLIVVSEVAYFWSVEDLARSMNLIAAHQSPGSHLLLVHWLAKVEDYPQTGDAVHDAWGKDSRWSVEQSARREKYRIDLLVRA